MKIKGSISIDFFMIVVDIGFEKNYSLIHLLLVQVNEVIASEVQATVATAVVQATAQIVAVVQEVQVDRHRIHHLHHRDDQGIPGDVRAVEREVLRTENATSRHHFRK